MIQTALAQFLKSLLKSCFKCDIGYAEMHKAFYSYIQLSPNEAHVVPPLDFVWFYLVMMKMYNIFFFIKTCKSLLYQEHLAIQ